MLSVASRGLALSVGLVCIAFALGSPSVALTILVTAPAVFALFTGARFVVPREGEAIVSFAALASGAVLPRALAIDTSHMTGVLSDRTLFFVCPMLLVAGTRAALRTPSYGARGTLAVALVALCGAGRVKLGPSYAILSAAFLVAAVVTLATTDPARALPKDGRLRAAARGLGSIVIAGAVTLAIALPLPALHARIVDRIMSGFQDRTGFSDQVTLGDLHGMLLSNRVVLRVRNGSPDYLRGAVFSTYSHGQWQSGTNEVPTFHQGERAPADPSRYVQIEYAQKPERYFLPQGSTDVVVSTGSFAGDRLGVRWAYGDGWAKRAWFVPGENPELAGPVPADLDVPRDMRAGLGGLLDAWGVRFPLTGRERLLAIDRKLKSEYTYSLTYERTPRTDFVMDFLTTHKEGHCEYFASAFVLLAREAGVSARLVNGFRVTERSPFSDYGIVRERNAHSWAEVWLDGKWTTWDPTPSAPGMAESSETSWGAAVFDYLATSWEKVDDFLTARTPFQLTLALVLLVGLLILARTLRLRQTRALRAAPPPLDPPLPAFVAFERALAQRGLTRPHEETLEAFASRLELDERAEIAPTAHAVRTYAAHRYGGRVDQRVVEHVLGEAMMSLR